jgi:hypothetical protein
MKPAVLPARPRFVATVGALLMSAALAGCTESGDEDFVTEHGLRMQASAFYNGMPSLYTPECPKISVGISIRAGGRGFPESLSIKGVEAQYKGVSAAPVAMTVTSSEFVEADITEDNWLHPTVFYAQGSPQPVTFKETILRGTASVCEASLAGSVANNAELTLAVRLESAGRSASLAGPAVMSVVY